MGLKSLVVNTLTGVGLMYFLDPQSGKRRRALLRDKLAKLQSNTTYQAEALAKDASNRARGKVIETVRHVAPGAVADDVLVARVRSNMGHHVARPANVQVEAENGIVTLSGKVQISELQPLVSRVRSMAGVRGVENKLDVDEMTENAAQDEETAPESAS